MKNNNIVLIGFKNAGKSTVAELIASALDYRLVDTDRLTEALFTQAQGIALSRGEIYRIYGESTFRDKEETALAFLKDSNHSVIATGGGMVLRQSNRQLLRNLGTVIYLNADLATVLQRIDHSNPPAFTVEQKRSPLDSLSSQYRQRIPLYESIADIKIDVSNKSAIKIKEEILTYLDEPIYANA